MNALGRAASSSPMAIREFTERPVVSRVNKLTTRSDTPSSTVLVCDRGSSSSSLRVRYCGACSKIMTIVDRHGLPLSVSTHAANHLGRIHRACRRPAKRHRGIPRSKMALLLMMENRNSLIVDAARLSESGQRCRRIRHHASAVRISDRGDRG